MTTSGLLARQVLEHHADRPEELRDRVLAIGQAGERPEAFGGAALGDELRDGRAGYLGSVAGGHPRGRLDELDDRPERDALAVGEAAATEHPRRRRQAIDELVHEAALADAGVAAHSYPHAGDVSHGGLEAVDEAGKLSVTPPSAVQARVGDRAAQTPSTRNAGTGSALPLSVRGSSSTSVAASPTSRRVSPPMTTWPRAAVCSRRAATLTASP